MKSNLRISAKKKRALINLKLKNYNIFLENINICLNKVLSIDSTIKIVGLYYPILNEISPLAVINYLESNCISSSLPVVDIETKSMVFKKWHPKDKLKKGHLGNYEPSLASEIVFPQIILVPMLMYDKKFNRLGYGGGYYDKSIFSLKQYFHREEKGFYSIGLAYSEQETKSIEYESHDQKLDFIVTEKEILSKVD